MLHIIVWEHDPAGAAPAAACAPPASGGPLPLEAFWPCTVALAAPRARIEMCAASRKTKPAGEQRPAPRALPARRRPAGDGVSIDARAWARA
eukprot:2410750-Prymnesium_polylepis.1